MKYIYPDLAGPSSEKEGGEEGVRRGGKEGGVRRGSKEGE